MIADRKKEHDIKEMQRFLETMREEHNEHFETVLKEAINHICLVQEKALGDMVSYSLYFGQLFHCPYIGC